MNVLNTLDILSVSFEKGITFIKILLVIVNTSSAIYYVVVFQIRHFCGTNKCLCRIFTNHKKFLSNFQLRTATDEIFKNGYVNVNIFYDNKNLNVKLYLITKDNFLFFR